MLAYIETHSNDDNLCYRTGLSEILLKV